MTNVLRAVGAVSLLAGLAACSQDQQSDVDSAAGSVASAAQATMSVLNIETGRTVEADRSIADETETFAPNDTIYASVITTGSAEPGTMVSRWTFPDGSVVDQPADSGAVAGRMLFFITKPEGLATGTYKFQVLVDGQEVRSEEVTVQAAADTTQ